MPIVIPSTASAEGLESLVLDGLELNDLAAFSVEAATHTPAPKKPEWISGADSDGALLGRDPLYENCTWELRLRVAQQATMDTALAQVGVIEDKLQECSRNANGLSFVWTPANASDSITFRCLLGEFTDRPIDMADSGWFQYNPVLGIRLTCLPFGLGAETLLGSVTSSDPLVTLEVDDVAGDVPALGRLVVTDAASQSRRWVAWGMESRWYPTSSPAALLIDAPTMMSTTGYAGATATRTGAYSGGTNNVISATLRTQVQAICTLGNLSHVGSFRPQMRYYATATTMAVRLTYQTLDGPFRALSYSMPVAVGWNHVDLGLITIPQAVLGTQKWTGRIEAVSTATGGETFQVDYVSLIPAELFGRARASLTSGAGVLTGFDDFAGIGTGTVLNGRTAPVGGTWATSGSATDFAAADAPAATDETMSRSTTTDGGAPRFAILGSTNYAATEVGCDVAATLGMQQGVIARWVDASNYLLLLLTRQPDSSAWEFTLYKTVSGSLTALAQQTVTGLPLGAYQLRLTAYASGRAVGTWSQGGGTIATVEATDTVLAAGGALDDGKPGMFDLGFATASTRYFDNFYAATPAAEPIVCYSGQSVEFRHDVALREDSTGTYSGPPPEYIGSRFYVPNAGGPGRKARVAIMAKRHDVDSVTDDYIADSTTVQVYATSRYLVVPR